MRSDRRRSIRVSWLVLLALVLVGGCSAEPDEVFVSGETRPLRSTEGWSAEAVAASVTDPPTMAAGDLAAGKPVWMSLGVVRPSSGAAVEILDARAITSVGIARSEVYVGREGIDGGYGFWSPDSVPPVDQTTGLTGAPRLARGALLDADHDWVVYVVGELSPGVDGGWMAGARLTVRDGDGQKVMIVNAGGLLCAAAVVGMVAMPDDPWACPTTTAALVPAPPSTPG